MNPFRSLFLSLSRMPPILMLFIILGLAVVVTMLVQSKMSEQESAFKQKEAAMQEQLNRKGTVVVTTKDIAEGEEITADALDVKEIEAGKIPEGACTSKDEATGQTAAYALQTGATVLRVSLKLRTMITSGFESRIKEGMRAVTFGVDNNSGVAGFIAPGSHVDILATTGAGADTKAAPVMSDVEVIAVGTTYTKAPGAASANPAGSVTVATTPEDAEKLVKAVKAASLYLTLRNDKDHTPVAVVDVSTLFPKPPKPMEEVAEALPPPPLPAGAGGGAGAPMAASAPPPPPPMHEIELWSGSKKEILSVPAG